MHRQCMTSVSVNTIGKAQLCPKGRSEGVRELGLAVAGHALGTMRAMLAVKPWM